MTNAADDHHLLWHETSRELLVTCPIFSLHRSERRAPSTGAGEKSGAFFLLEARDWVTVVPVVRSGAVDSFLMVRQYRHGLDRVTLEFPAGIVEPGELPEHAARRELAEETGYSAPELVHAATTGAAPAFMNNRCHVYVASGLGKRRGQRLDDNERLDVVTVPVEEVVQGMGRGELVNSITAASLFFYLRGASRISTGGERQRTEEARRQARID